MKKVVTASFLLLSLIAAPAAAQTWVVVDRDAAQDLLRAGRRQVRSLRRLSEGDREMRAHLARLRRILRKLARQVRRSPLASAVHTGFPSPPPVMMPGQKPTVMPAPSQVPTAYAPPPPPPIQVGPQAMAPEDFKRLLGTIGAEPFPDEKLGILRQAAKVNHFTVAQATRLLRQVTFDRRRLSALATLAPRLVDPDKAFSLPGLFTFSHYKRKAREILGRIAR